MSTVPKTMEMTALQESLAQLIFLTKLMLTQETDDAELFTLRMQAREEIIQALPKKLSPTERATIEVAYSELMILDKQLETRFIEIKNRHCQALRKIHFSKKVIAGYTQGQDCYR